ncbi:endoplasmic oxidoreductin [Venturia nashicola]|uniref:Endoplasmic oxidoreductin n=1 Tax=Venturia nashicola TaxID=86259 RepID=A0A4Z1P0W7_9PEZI|nr:endoplasmic oxidoreductin [Venturia nashicola]
MRHTAAQVFYLAVFSLLGTSHASAPSKPAQQAKEPGQSPNVCAVSPRPRPSTNFTRLRHKTQSSSQYEPNTIVGDACASYSTLDDLNAALHPSVHAVTQDTDFFSHYRLNLFDKKCPFWSDENGMCGNIACAVNTLDNEEDIPLAWRADALGKLDGKKAEHPGRKLQKERPRRKPLQGQLGEDVGESCVVEYDDECDERDYCVPEDESATSKGDYVSLVDNPERFTGYAGAGAQQVWEAIYRENCFQKPGPVSEDKTGSSAPFGFSNSLQAGAAQDLKNVIKKHEQSQGIQQAIARGSSMTPVDELDFDDECVEKRVFYRLVSGMHASISTHLCWDYFNQSTGLWYRNTTCYKQRLHNHPERISNLYFNYALLVRAVGKLRGHLPDYTFCSADPEQDRLTKGLLKQLSQSIGDGGDVFDESVMFKSPDAAGLKEDFRNRFRNVSRIMDCVGCDKCRLWGKVQTNGYGTALKILFEFDEKNPKNDPPLRRTELVALLNTLDRVGHSLMAISEFKRMVDAEETSNTRATSTQQQLDSKKPTNTTKSVSEERDDALPPYKRRTDPDMTISEVFWDEWDLIWRTFKYVLRGWIEFPGKAYDHSLPIMVLVANLSNRWRIFIWEMGRMWNLFVGLNAPERNWEWKLPKHDEI